MITSPRIFKTNPIRNPLYYSEKGWWKMVDRTKSFLRKINDLHARLFQETGHVSELKKERSSLRDEIATLTNKIEWMKLTMDGMVHSPVNMVSPVVEYDCIKARELMNQGRYMTRRGVMQCLTIRDDMLFDMRKRQLINLSPEMANATDWVEVKAPEDTA